MRQLGEVLEAKTEAEYSGRAVTRHRAEKVVRQAGRFVHWAAEVVSGA